MSRVINIAKVGKSTIVEIADGEATPEVFVFNKLTDLILRNDVIEVKTQTIRLFMKYDEISNKLASTDAKDYLNKAAAIFLFNQ